MALPAIPITGCAARVSVMASRWAAWPPGVKEWAGNTLRRIRCGRSAQVALEAGEGHEQVAEHARTLAPLAGEQEGHRPSHRRAGGEDPQLGVAAQAHGDGQLARQIVEVLGDESSLDGCTATRGSQARSEVAQPERRPGSFVRCDQGRQLLHGGDGGGASVPRKQNSSAGHSSAPNTGSGLPSYPLSTAWKFVPPKPKALTPAIALPGVDGPSGRACWSKKKGLVAGSQPGFGTVIGPVGGRTPGWRA